MYHSVRFAVGSTVKNSWDDWYLVPSSRPVINPPKPKYVTVDIPGANGAIDLSEVTSGEVVYENRTGSIEFIVFNEKPMEWFELYSQIMDYLHGKPVQISLEDEIPAGSTIPSYYYEGRCEVDGWQSGANYSTISITYDLYPYKFATQATSETINLSSTNVQKTYKNGRMAVIPKFTVSDTCTVTWKGNEYTLSKGENAVANIVFEEGNNTISFKGSGTVTITFREGRL